jgi:hypothetical protein
MWCDNEPSQRIVATLALTAGLLFTAGVLRAQSAPPGGAPAPPAGAAAPADIGPCCDAAAGDCPLARYQGRRVALLFGSDDYPNFPAQFKKLKNARNDAVALAKILKKQGFSVACVLDPTKRQVIQELEQLKAHLNQVEREASNLDPRALVYIAGHGGTLENAEYVFFRPDAGRPLGNAYENARSSLENIRSQFSGLDKFDLTLIVDACRSNVSAPPGQPADGTRGDAGTFNGPAPTDIGTQLFIAYATYRGSVAIDWRAGDPETAKNGLFMSRLLRFIDLPGIDQETAFTFTEAAVTSAGSSQNPGHFKLHHQRSGMSWIPPAGSSQCARMSDAIWKQRSYCAFNNADACKEEICGTYAWVAADRPTQTCLAGRNFLLGDNVSIGQFCAAVAATNTATRSAFVTINNPAIRGTDLSQIEALGIASTFASAVIDAQSSITEAAIASNNTSARAAARDALLNLQASSMVVARIEPPVDGLAVRNLPHADARRISNISDLPTRNVRPGRSNIQIDCQAAPCNESWIGLRYGQGRTRTLGWVPADLVKLAEPAQPRIEVKYRDKDFNLDAATIKEINKQLAAIDLKKPMTVWLTAPKQPAQEDAYLSEARLVNARAVIRRAGVEADKIVSTLVTTQWGNQDLPGLTIRIDGTPIGR